MFLSTRYHTAVSLLLLATLTCFSGCSDGVNRPQVVPVTGKVTWQGKPVQGATVVFFAPSSPRAARGETDAQGQFKLTTFNSNDGAVPGEHTITITKVKQAAPTPPINLDNPGEAYTKAMTEAANAKIDNELPSRYADPAQSGLVRTVTLEGPNDFGIDLE